MSVTAPKRLVRSVKSTLRKLRRESYDHVGKAVSGGVEGERLWAERNIRDVYALDFVRMDQAAERAASATGQGPAILGVVMMVPQIKSSQEWEVFAAEQDKPAAIEAAVIEKKAEE